MSPCGKLNPQLGSMIPIEPANQSWWPTPLNITRPLPGIGRGSARWSGHTLWLPHSTAVPVPSWFVVHRLWTRFWSLSEYSQRE